MACSPSLTFRLATSYLLMCATQWAAVRMCFLVIKLPPQNWRPLFISAAIQGHSPWSASQPFTILAPASLARSTSSATCPLLSYRIGW